MKRLLTFLLGMLCVALPGLSPREPETRQLMKLLAPACRGAKLSAPAVKAVLERFTKEDKASAPARLARLKGFLANRPAAPARGTLTAAQVKHFADLYRNDSEAGPPKDVPYPNQCVAVAKYQAESRTLVFVGSAHLHGDESGKPSPPAVETYREMKNAFLKEKPKVMVVEGIPTSLGPSPCFIALENLLLTDAEVAGEGESAFAIRLALDANVPFVGGEPDTAAKMTAALAEMRRARWPKGQEPDGKDLAFFLMLENLVTTIAPDPKDRGLAAMREEYRNLEQHVLSADVLTALGLKRNDLGGWAGFTAWYKRRMGRDAEAHWLKSPVDELVAETGPIESVPAEQTPYSRRISILATKARNQSLHETLVSLSARSSPVMVVYGAGHLQMLHPALVASVGPARFTRVAESPCENSGPEGGDKGSPPGH